MPTVQKVVLYITRGRQLLVFDHRDHPEAGTQVPAGTVEPQEGLVKAAIREAQEETGLSDARLVGILGSAMFEDSDGASVERHYFHLVTSDPRDSWLHWETHGGSAGDRYSFVFRWVSLEDAITLVHPQLGVRLPGLQRAFDEGRAPVAPEPVTQKEWKWLPGVFAAIFDESERLLFVRHNYGRKLWSLPGGGIEDHETVVDALKREVLEETGLEVEPDVLIGSYSRPEPNRQTVLIRCKVVGGSLRGSSHEISEVRYFSKGELPSELSAAGRARTKDAFSGQLGFVRVFDPGSEEYR